ncbi:MAG: hypothetical protein ACK451_19775, partial [Pseudanabaena sp.]
PSLFPCYFTCFKYLICFAFFARMPCINGLAIKNLNLKTKQLIWRNSNKKLVLNALVNLTFWMSFEALLLPRF